MKSLQETIRDNENKKRSLEEEVDSLTEECAKLKSASRFYVFITLIVSCSKFITLKYNC